MGAGDRFADARFLIRGLSLGAQQIPVQHIVNQSGFAGAGHAGYAREDAERKVDVDVLQVVRSGAENLDRRIRFSAQPWDRD